jgi:hypothetical protein
MGVARRADGSAGDADYGHIGVDYAEYRQPDPLEVRTLPAGDDAMSEVTFRTRWP